jgi:uncharacterized membrane protein
MSAFLAQNGPWLAIFGMWAVTYLWRAGGFAIMGLIPRHVRIDRALAALPGCIVTAAILPIIAEKGFVAVAGIAIAMLVMRVIRSDLLSVAAGLGSVILLRGIL